MKYVDYRGRKIAIKPNYGILEIWIDGVWTGAGCSCNTYPGNIKLAKSLIDTQEEEKR